MELQGVTPQPLPFILRVPDTATRRLGLPGPKLTPESVTKSAARAARLPARFPTWVEEALEVLCRSLRDEADLHWFGKMNQWTLIVTGLTELLQVEQLFRDDPSLAEAELVPPVFLTGLPRSGTTFLHRLLSVPEDAASVALYQHVYPAPRRSALRRRTEFAARFAPWRKAGEAYHVDAMHLMRPELPDECNWGMRVGLHSMIFWSAAPAYGYLRWLLDRDMRESYELYRKVLLIHQRQVPGQRLTLKCPHHLSWLPALRDAFPDAHIVQTHRDPAETIPSECKLTLSMQAMATHRLDQRRSVQSILEKNEENARRAVSFASSSHAGVVHVDYRRLVTAPVQVVTDVHDAFGLRFSDRDGAALRAFTEANRQHKHGRNPYSLAQFGLDETDIGERLHPYYERVLTPEARPQAPVGR